MRWLFKAARRLRDLGILGMNRRNAACILDHNPRSKFPLVDDKYRMHDLCRRIGVPTPKVYAVVDPTPSCGSCPRCLGDLDDFVDQAQPRLRRPRRAGPAGRSPTANPKQPPFTSGTTANSVDLDSMRQHLSDILSGMYSLGGQCDQALIQQRVRLHPAFAAITYKGIPDVRVVLYRNEPAMAMLRLPTKESNGRANLHQGGIGTGVDLDTGMTHHAVQRNRFVEFHPDTKLPVVGVRVPYWQEVLRMSRQVAEAVGLGYIGVDIVVDEVEGPMLLEANARPGLAIQIANGRGLVPRLNAIDAMIRDRKTMPSDEDLVPVLAQPHLSPVPEQEQPLRQSA